MSKMSTIVKRIVTFGMAAGFFTASSLALATFSAHAEEGVVWSYEEAYKKSVKQVCERAWNPNNGSIIRIKEFSYPEIGSATADKQYRKGVEGVGGDVSGIGEILASNGAGSPFDFGRDAKLASETYKERMNGIFACAQINFKIRTHEQLLKTVRAEKADGGNTVKKIEEQTKLLKQELSRRNCANRTSTEGKANVFMKKDLLNQTTYEYCNYRHYLQYLKANAQNRLSKFIEAEEARKKSKGETVSEDASKAAKSGSSEELLASSASVVSSIDSEIRHTREVFPQAMIAYNEFERTYGSHVVMLFILEDYSLLRDSLKKIMNPLGQVIYKASNAQSPRNP